MGDYLNSNRQLWNKWTPLHEQSLVYKVAEFKSFSTTHKPVEHNELKNVADKRVAPFAMAVLDLTHSLGRVGRC